MLYQYLLQITPGKIVRLHDTFIDMLSSVQSNLNQDDANRCPLCGECNGWTLLHIFGIGNNHDLCDAKSTVCSHYTMQRIRRMAYETINHHIMAYGRIRHMDKYVHSQNLSVQHRDFQLYQDKWCRLEAERLSEGSWCSDLFRLSILATNSFYLPDKHLITLERNTMTISRDRLLPLLSILAKDSLTTSISNNDIRSIDVVPLVPSARYLHDLPSVRYETCL